jgi:DNA-binding CsgD family transcriptional regulator
MPTTDFSAFEKVFYDNLKYFQQQIIKPDYSQTNHLKKYAQTIDAIENRPTYILDLYTSDFFFVSERYLHLLGYNANTPLNFNFFIDALHPDDYWITTDAPVAYFTFLETQTPEEKFHYKLISDFRLRMPTGEYVRVIEQIILLHTDSKGNPWLVLAICDLSPNQNLNTQSSGKIISTITGEMVKPIGEHQLQNPSLNLTRREKEILILISKGYSSKQIAGKLNISTNTVNNHRRNILCKTGCLNTFEAIKYVGGGLL